MQKTPEQSLKVSHLRNFGVLGWEKIEPVIIAALVTRTPLLLIGSHGTAKSLVLERLAQGLSLNFRHYNASTLNFDDLVGFPVPDGERIKYLRTPLDAWSAEAIFIDEISRCRIDMQNRLFPLVHECRLQGQKLSRLIYRWAAMNPPPRDDDDEDKQYIGAEILDPAFADRFPWIIAVPERLSNQDLLQMIRGPKVDKHAGRKLKKELREIYSRLGVYSEVYAQQTAGYVQSIYLCLQNAGFHLSNRRLRYLYQNIIGLLATERYADPREAAFTALEHSIPQRCWRPINKVMLHQADKVARSYLSKELTGIQKKLLLLTCPVERSIAVLQDEDEHLTTPIIMEAHSSLGFASRLTFSWVLFEVLRSVMPHLPALLFENLAEDVRRVRAVLPQDSEISANHPQYNEIVLLKEAVPAQYPWLLNVLFLSLQCNRLKTFADALDLLPKLKIFQQTFAKAAHET